MPLHSYSLKSVFHYDIHLFVTVRIEYISKISKRHQPAYLLLLSTIGEILEKWNLLPEAARDKLDFDG